MNTDTAVTLPKSKFTPQNDEINYPSEEKKK